MLKNVSILLLLLCAWLPMSAQCDHPDYEGLMQLYHATDGDNWDNNEGWKDGAEGKSCDPCSWRYIGCRNNRVRQISIFQNNLTGSIPDLQLDTLFALSLGKTDLTGAIPNFSGLPLLERLNLSENNLTGDIPDFKSVPKLETLYLDDNALTGGLVDLPTLSSLEVLDLENNPLGGGLIDFSNLPALEKLNLDNCQLEGHMVDFSNMPMLKTLTLTRNNISGPIMNFSALPNLEELFCKDNALTGPIPKFENSRHLLKIVLSENPITGVVPDFTFQPRLTNFICNSCELTGGFPDFSTNKKLINIEVLNNKLTGFLPDFSDYPALRFIVADGNDLEGCYQAFESDTALIEISGSRTSYSGNTRMPFFGNLQDAYVMDQVGAPCAIPGYDNYSAFINEDCKCVLDACESPHPDLEALIQIYKAAGGENWIDNTGWKGAADGFRCDPCDDTFGIFYGVVCEEGRVVCLDLDGLVSCDFNGFGGNNLSGTWPDVELDLLEMLILDDNSISGKVPDLSGMGQLRELRASHNNFTGEIKPFSENPHLTTVRLSYNNLTGPLPETKLSSRLQYLTVAENNLSGCYADWMCNLQLFNALGNRAMPWGGDNEAFCNGTTQDDAPCINGVGKEGIIKGCFCCEAPDENEQTHVCVQSIYPNPTQTELFISNLQEGTQYIIYDTQGQLVSKERLQVNSIDVTALSSGVYFLSFENAQSESVLLKFIKH